jgi:short-subunit dehydrogenase
LAFAIAVVTGCTDGIGRAYIEELAEVRGIRKFYLIARSSEKLKVVEEELSEICGHL